MQHDLISCLKHHLQVPFAKNIYGLIAPNFGVGFAIGEKKLHYLVQSVVYVQIRIVLLISVPLPRKQEWWTPP